MGVAPDVSQKSFSVMDTSFQVLLCLSSDGGIK